MDYRRCGGAAERNFVAQQQSYVALRNGQACGDCRRSGHVDTETLLHSNKATLRFAMEYRFFDPAARTEVSQGNLPHWEQLNAYYFITWRTADSLPQAALERWQIERDQWLRTRGINPSVDDWQRVFEMLPEMDRQEFHKLFTVRWNALLDEGHGECLLRRAELGGIVEDSLKHFAGERYELEAYAIMPNHVHVLAGISGRGEMKQVCRNWKNFTAAQINKALGRTGQFWQWESFDHLVRTPASLEKFRQYILNNPVKARLKEGEYRAWAKPK